MRRSLVLVSLLLLSLLLSKVEGIRLEKGFLKVQQRKHHNKESTVLKRSNSGVEEEAIICKDKYCTSTTAGKTKNRKLVSTSISSTHSTMSKKLKNGGNEARLTVRNVRVDGEEEEVKVDTSATSKHHEHYPDPVDIAEMDYSPAKRKPPIHN